MATTRATGEELFSLERDAEYHSCERELSITRETKFLDGEAGVLEHRGKNHTCGRSSYQCNDLGVTMSKKTSIPLKYQMQIHLMHEAVK
ncbi:hypothetical protein SUGI_0253050 [Cryptomeria japonica]|nr:hypothetical protein SUGI_0253050 [Cryptomeria japonica]